METSLLTELYVEQKRDVWPKTGRHILAQYDDMSIVVYQAFCPEIADYAVKNGAFGGPKYSFSRMTWIKTNFLWMMYRSGWAKKKNQERILAIFLKREGFDEILRSAREGKAPQGTNDHGEGPDQVRLQWDPDLHPNGSKLERRAIQLGLRGKILATFNQEWVLKIEDVTNFVNEQSKHLTRDSIEQLVTPRERTYIPSDASICRHIRLYDFHGNGADCGGVTAESSSTGATKETLEYSVEGACCGALLDERIADSNKSTSNVMNHANKDRQTSTDVIICLGGAFNPVHTRHIQGMVETKKWLEENTGFKVIAGILAVAPDGYVRNKCKKNQQRCIKAEHRVKMCELACKEFDWLRPYRKSTGSANQGGKQFLKENGLKNVKLVIIVGADRAVNKAGKAKWHTDKDIITVCVGREGETSKVQEAFAKDQESGRVSSDNFYILPKEQDNVSSTEIRKRLCFEDIDDVEKQNTIDKLIEVGWLHAEVGQYILQNETDLNLQ